MATKDQPKSNIVAEQGSASASSASATATNNERTAHLASTDTILSFVSPDMVPPAAATVGISVVRQMEALSGVRAISLPRVCTDAYNSCAGTQSWSKIARVRCGETAGAISPEWQLGVKRGRGLGQGGTDEDWLEASRATRRRIEAASSWQHAPGGQ